MERARCHSEPPSRLHRRRVASGIGREQLDLVGGQVELVAAPVLEQQIVAGGPAHGPGDHPAVAGHAVLAVDDVIARGEVVEEAVDGPGPGPGLAVGAAAPGDVGLGQNGHLRSGKDEAPVDSRHHDPGSGRWSGRGCLVDPVGAGRSAGDGYGDDDALLGQDARQPVGAAGVDEQSTTA